ncbi:actin-85C-like isoform X2 [Phyllostomus hastatus]|uniref:actin-85C-like isoform X2 n=1 Tax=Phyllostomus hastatus TaxID=9423 RepID=UPI001E6845C1|nr:actin-85C-like isoform X2 [Phyllostomus hastatus]
MKVPLVGDFGSGFSKVGFSGMGTPLAVFPTILGKLKHDGLLVGLDEKDWFLGDEVQSRLAELNLLRPICRARVTNWDHMEKIWHYSFYRVLCAAPEQHPLLLTEPPSSTPSAKEKVSQILFETFSVPALYLANQGVLSLYASGLTSGTAIESGEGMTHFVPVSEGCPLHQSTMKMEVAGQDITLYLMQLLSAQGNSLISTGDRECVRHLKEKHCYVAVDFDKARTEAPTPPPTEKCLLPDGREVTLGQERFFGPEVLFQTDLIGRHTLGAHMIAFRCVSSCDPALWKILFDNIVLSGGTGSCLGLRSRMQRELCALVSPTIAVEVSTCPFSKYGAWVGGSMLCSLSTFKDMWVTSKEYQDMGSSMVCRRSF